MLATAVLLASCVSVPQEAPELSAELGREIASLEASHTRLVQVYFAERRHRVERFLEDEWAPHFAREVFDEPAIRNIWNQVVESDDEEARVKFITILGPRIQARIDEKRRELIDPIDRIEQQVLTAIHAKYNRAKLVNGTITSVLSTAVNEDPDHDQLMKLFDPVENRLGGVLSRVDTAVEHLTTVRGGGASALLKTGQQFRSQIDDVIQELGVSESPAR